MKSVLKKNGAEIVSKLPPPTLEAKNSPHLSRYFFLMIKGCYKTTAKKEVVG
jgi:hypothetical protein